MFLVLPQHSVRYHPQTDRFQGCADLPPWCLWLRAPSLPPYLRTLCLPTTRLCVCVCACLPACQMKDTAEQLWSLVSAYIAVCQVCVRVGG